MFFYSQLLFKPNYKDNIGDQEGREQIGWSN